MKFKISASSSYLVGLCSFGTILFSQAAPGSVRTKIPCKLGTQRFGPPKDIRQVSLESVKPATTESWRDLPNQPNSEQRRPVNLGQTPRESVLDLPAEVGSLPTMPAKLRDAAREQALAVSAALGRTEGQFEVWPAFDDYGAMSLVFSRHRANASEPWKWLTEQEIYDRLPQLSLEPILPRQIKVDSPADRAVLFDEYWQHGDGTKRDSMDLYMKPIGSETVWIDAQGSIAASWVPAPRRNQLLSLAGSGEPYTVYQLPPPSRFNDKPTTFILEVRDGRVYWRTPVRWKAGEKAQDVGTAESPQAPLEKWPEHFQEEFESDVRVLTGEEPITLPDGNKIRLERLNNGQKDNQLTDLAKALKFYHEGLGLEVEMQPVRWNGRTHYNVIAKIKGSLPPGKNKPVLLADHIDRAIAEDIYVRLGKFLSTKGANDNVTAMATLLRAAHILKNSKPLHDIWLTHLTGEEFPADCLGARHLTYRLLKDKIDIKGMVLLDMIGFRTPGDRIFQISPGSTAASMSLAATALTASRIHAPTWTPVLRNFTDPRSYLRQTDGEVLDGAGFPVILFNENINILRKRNAHYHQESDVAGNVDFVYAADIARSAIATVNALAHDPR